MEWCNNFYFICVCLELLATSANYRMHHTNTHSQFGISSRTNSQRSVNFSLYNVTWVETWNVSTLHRKRINDAKCSRLEFGFMCQNRTYLNLPEDDIQSFPKHQLIVTAINECNRSRTVSCQMLWVHGTMNLHGLTVSSSVRQYFFLGVSSLFSFITLAHVMIEPTFDRVYFRFSEFFTFFLGLRKQLRAILYAIWAVERMADSFESKSVLLRCLLLLCAAAWKVG